jgi:Ca2+-binding EF-hand superfamily protein
VLLLFIDIFSNHDDMNKILYLVQNLIFWHACSENDLVDFAKIAEYSWEVWVLSHQVSSTALAWSFQDSTEAYIKVSKAIQAKGMSSFSTFSTQEYFGSFEFQVDQWFNSELIFHYWQAIFFWIFVVRHLSRQIENSDLPAPLPTPMQDALEMEDYKSTALSTAQASQIHEIFELFDTDGGGTIDMKELQFAMIALGFHDKEYQYGKGNYSRTGEIVGAMVGDGKVTLEEFSALMTGQGRWQDPYKEARTVFAVLSRPDSEHRHNGLITLNKLEAVCQEYEVWLISPCWYDSTEQEL